MPALSGFPRSDGSWGIRNHVLVMPVRAAANRVADALTAGVVGAVAVSHEWEGRPDDADAELIERTLVGFACSPNVSTALFVGVTSPDERLLDSVRARGRTAECIMMADHGGTPGTIRAGRPIVERLVERASSERRHPMPISALCIGLECGGSDGMSGITANPALGLASDRLVAQRAMTVLGEIPELVGAEYLLASRAVSDRVADAVVDLIHTFERSVRALGIDIRGAQPTPGNINGGLTTIEEKSLGAAKKAGGARVSGVLAFGERPVGPGLYLMDTPGHDIEQLVGFVAGGCQIVAFTTGRGTPTGSAIAPCIKISTNSAIFRRMAGDIDLNAGDILDGDISLEGMGEAIYDAIVAVAGGQLTASEVRGNREFAVRRTTYT